MKKIIILAILIPTLSHAQNYPGMGGGMPQMMQNMQNCIQNIDQSRIKALQQRSSAFQVKVKALCSSGQRDSAQALALSFAQEIKNNPDMQMMKKCAELMKNIMPGMSHIIEYQDNSSRHVCDSL